MRRINIGKLPRHGFQSADSEPLRKQRFLHWTNALLMAHVETPRGPDLQILREEIGEEAVLRIEAGSEETSWSSAMLVVESDEIIISLETDSIDNSSDASMMAGFEADVPMTVTADGVGNAPQVAVILRNFEEGLIHVLDRMRRTAELVPGLWTIQAAAVPDGIEHAGVLTFDPVRHE